MWSRWIWIALSAAMLMACSAVGTGVGNAVRSLNPLAEYKVGVVQATPRGMYYVARLRGDGLDLRFFVPATDDCRDLMETSLPLSYRRSGLFGELSDGEKRCDMAGVASLAAWRDRLGRVEGKAFPRGFARFEEVFRDEEVVLLRGRFPLLNRIRMPSGVDAIAMVPTNAECMGPVSEGQASIEFSDSSRWAYRLVSGMGPCEIEGFALPPQN